MLKKLCKKTLAGLLALCMVFSMLTVSIAGVSAAPTAAPVKPNIWVTSAKSFGVNKIYTTGLLVCGTALTKIAASTDCEEFQAVASFLNKWVFGGGQGQTLGEIVSLCNQILDEVRQIDAKLTAYTAELEQMMSEVQFNEAMRYVNDTWQTDVTNIENSNNIRNTLTSYQNYMSAAQQYSQGSATLEEVERAQDGLFDDFCRIYSSINGGFTDEENTEEIRKAMIFGDSTIDDALTNAIRTMANNLTNDTNYADVVAQFAYQSLPFANDQHDYILTQIDRQFMEIILLEMMYQEFLAQRGEYLSESYPDDTARWDSYSYYTDRFNSLNETVANAMSTMLDRELKVSPVNGITMTLDEYPQAEDAVSVVLHNSSYQNRYTQYSPTALRNLYTYSDAVNQNVVFHRVFTLTPSGVNTYYILDGTQFDDTITQGEIPYHMHLTRLVDPNDISWGPDVHIANADFRNLTQGKYGDGANSDFSSISSGADLVELFNTPAFSLCGSKPIDYLSDYLSYASGYPIYILTSNYVQDETDFSTDYVHFMAINADSQEPSGEFSTEDVSAEELQQDRSNYNTAYSVILKNNNAALQQNLDFAVTGDGLALIEAVGENGQALNSVQAQAGSKVAIRFKGNSANTILQSVTLQRHNDTTDKSKVTSETTLFTKEQIELLDVDEQGYYTFEFTIPYSDATMVVNTQRGHTVYIQGLDGSNDLITLDSYINLFAEGETVNFIADSQVQSVTLQYGNVSTDVALSTSTDGEITGSFTMPNEDVVLVYSLPPCSHEFSQEGFCTKCGAYQPAVLNENNVYEISNAGQLYWFGALVNGDTLHAEFDEQNTAADGVLVNDIVINTGDLNTSSDLRQWNPIGSEDFPYSGQFSGQNHTISGLYLDTTGNFVGLFSCLQGAVIQDLTLSGKISSSARYVGGIAGYAQASTLTNVTNSAEVSGRDYVGGVVGALVDNNQSGAANTLHHCQNSGNVSAGNGNVGGVVGWNQAGAITDCSNSGAITSRSGGYVGGIVGHQNNNSSVSRCFNTGSVTDKNSRYVGGVVGMVDGASVEHCYNTAIVAGGSYVGGVVGYNINSASVKHCYSIGSQVSGSIAGPITGLNNGTLENCYYLDTCDLPEDSNLAGTGKTAEQFANGEVAYLLNNSVTDGTQVWYQNLDNGQTPDSYPVFTGGTVYFGATTCAGNQGYSNYPSGTQVAHQFDGNGFCVRCGAYQPAVLNDNNVYEISNAGQLYWFGALVNGDTTHAQFDAQNSAANAVLINDIVVNDGTITADSENVRSWIPIGTPDASYTGQFDGQRHTISGLYFKDSNADNVGLFGYTRGGADIYNLGLINSYLEGRNSVGGILGRNNNAGVTVQRSFSEAAVVGNQGVAGIVGSTYGGAIVDCYNAGSVTGSTYVGAIRGQNTYNNSGSGAIQNCFNVGSVTGTGTDYIGGIRGDGNGSIRNSYCIDTQLTDTAAVTKTAEQFAGGEVAYLLNSGVTDGTQVWYQNIDNGQTLDPYPVFEGGTVYYLDGQEEYSNTDYQPPVQPDAFDRDENGNLIIRTYEDLVLLSQLVRSDYETYGSQNYILVNNIRAAEDSSWTQGIGSVEENKPFNGTFYGNGYCIFGLNVNCAEYGGLFELIGENGRVQDLMVFDCNFTVPAQTAGGIAAINRGTIDHCISGVNFTTGTIHISADLVINASALNSIINGNFSGGIAGENSGLITGCRNAGIVNGTQCGGIAGVNTGRIYGSANNARIGSSTTSVSGGLAGQNGGSIESCYNSGSVNGSSQQAVGSIAGLNGYSGAESPVVQNVFYSTVGGMQAVGTDSRSVPEESNRSMASTADFKTAGFVDQLNAVSDETVVWVQNSVLNKGNPTIQGNFLKHSVKSAGNSITVEGSMHQALNIAYTPCNPDSSEYQAMAAVLGQSNILGMYSASLTDGNGNYIPAELWCQGQFKITLPADRADILLAGVDADGQVTYYRPDSVENGMAVFTVSDLASFAIVEAVNGNTGTDNNNQNDTTTIPSETTPAQTGDPMDEAVWLIALLISLAGLAAAVIGKRRNRN